jgi:hypothetical protein
LLRRPSPTNTTWLLTEKQCVMHSKHCGVVVSVFRRNTYMDTRKWCRHTPTTPFFSLLPYFHTCGRPCYSSGI